MSEIKVNDTVWVIGLSNAPQMMASGIDGDEAICLWYDEKRQLRREIHKLVNLTKEKPNKGETFSSPIIL
jgi:hypothetical protein